MNAKLWVDQFGRESIRVLMQMDLAYQYSKGYSASPVASSHWAIATTRVASCYAGQHRWCVSAYSLAAISTWSPFTTPKSHTHRQDLAKSPCCYTENRDLCTPWLPRRRGGTGSDGYADRTVCQHGRPHNGQLLGALQHLACLKILGNRLGRHFMGRTALTAPSTVNTMFALSFVPSSSGEGLFSNGTSRAAQDRHHLSSPLPKD